MKGETCGSIEDPRFFTGNGRLLLRTLRILSFFLKDFVKDWDSPNDEASDVVAEGHFWNACRRHWLKCSLVYPSAYIHMWYIYMLMHVAIYMQSGYYLHWWIVRTCNRNIYVQRLYIGISKRDWFSWNHYFFEDIFFLSILSFDFQNVFVAQLLNNYKHVLKHELKS